MVLLQYAELKKKNKRKINEGESYGVKVERSKLKIMKGSYEKQRFKAEKREM